MRKSRYPRPVAPSSHLLSAPLRATPPSTKVLFPPACPDSQDYRMERRPFIAVVDDDPSVRKAVQRLLRTAQMDAETYASGEAFLARPVDRDPDCIVVDVRMPGMSGPELRSQLLTLGRHIPTVYITAHTEKVPADPASPRVVPEVLLKPFDDRSLLDSIERCM